MYVDNFENYIKGPEFHASLVDLFGNGIFNANGEDWKYQRKTASHIFNVKNFRDHFTEYVKFVPLFALFILNICILVFLSKKLNSCQRTSGTKPLITTK